MAARGLVVLLLAASVLAACAAPPPSPEPRQLALAAPQERVIDEGLALLVERGYVIQHADADLGRIEAVLAAWPGYRLRLEAIGQGEQTRVAMTGWQGGRPLAPYHLDPLLVELQARLGLAP